jgi:hypothetical protein
MTLCVGTGWLLGVIIRKLMILENEICFGTEMNSCKGTDTRALRLDLFDRKRL